MRVVNESWFSVLIPRYVMGFFGVSRFGPANAHVFELVLGSPTLAYLRRLVRIAGAYHLAVPALYCSPP